MNNNLAHIAAAAFNRPVLLEPGYARLFYATLAGRYGLDAVINVQGEAESVASLQREAAGYSRSSRPNDRPYQVIDGIALLPVSGTLVHKFGFINPASGMTGYDGIQNRLAQAIADPEVRGVLMDYDTPGGTVAGAFDTADLIQRYGKLKPIWSLSYDMNASAGQLLAAAGNRRLITQTGQAGSVGVLVAHTNIEKMLAEQGAEITLIYSGSHKVDANPYQTLPVDVRERLQAEVDDTRQRFAAKVAGFTGMSLDAVLATEARLYEGQSAVEVGLADEVVNGADAVGLMSDHLNRQGTGTKIYTRGASTMKNEDQESNTDTTLATVQPTAAQVAELSQRAATAERERVLGILGCEEAKGRQDLAHKLVAKGMELDDAKDVLLSAPIAATDRTGQTALDTLAAQEHGAGLEAGSESDQNTDAVAGLSAAVTVVSARG